MFSNLDELRTKVQEVLASFTPARYWFSHRMALDFTFFISITSLKKWYHLVNGEFQRLGEGKLMLFLKRLDTEIT